MENINIADKKQWNGDLIYSFAFIVLAWVITLYGVSASSLFDPTVHPFIVRPYISLLYFLSGLGFQAGPIYFASAYGLPALFSVIVICLSVRAGRETPTIEGEGERKFFGFLTNNWQGVIPLLLIIGAVLNILFLWHVFAAVSLFEPSIFPELN